ncbi:MAG: hypothetical protein HQ513_18455 [Rhodospirillales bacterium]|nr:hypothetical protein [Rhodospirillales bacterium]
MKTTIHDKDSGAPCGEIEIPDDVMAAAEKVHDFLKNQPATTSLHGVTLDDD